MLYLEVKIDTRVAIVASSKKNAFQSRRQSSNVVNRISSDFIPYQAMGVKLTREALQNQAKEATLGRKTISFKATVASRLEKCRQQNKRAYDLSDELAEAHH